MHYRDPYFILTRFSDAPIVVGNLHRIYEENSNSIDSIEQHRA